MKAARRLRDDLQAASRHADRLAGFTFKEGPQRDRRGGRPPPGRPGGEDPRGNWVRTELVDAGTACFHSLGWPDAYPYTKAMGERVLVAASGRHGADHPRAAKVDH